MTAFEKIFGSCEDTAPAGAAYKNAFAKRGIAVRIAASGESTIAELAADLSISVPTATKLVEELVAEGLVVDLGKVETAGGRRPNIYGLVGDAAFFAGIDIGYDRLSLAVTNLTNQIVTQRVIDNFTLEDDPRCLETILTETEKFISDCGIPRDKIFAAGVSIPGRVNTSTGESYRFFADLENPLREIFAKRLKLDVSLENATRVQCYAEYVSRIGTRNMLYINMSRELTIAIVADGKLYYGKNGFAGEFGHTPFFDNNVICSCGKRGCLETEVSGFAVENRMRDLIQNGVNTMLREKIHHIHIDDIIDAAVCGDTLSLELIEEVAAKAGKSIALLLSIFNPETVVIGGNLAKAGDYLMLPLRAAVNKHAPNPVSYDTEFGVARNIVKINNKEINEAVGTALMIRNKTTGLL